MEREMDEHFRSKTTTYKLPPGTDFVKFAEAATEHLKSLGFQENENGGLSLTIGPKKPEEDAR